MNKRLHYLVLICGLCFTSFLQSPSCYGQQTLNLELTHDDIQRQYILYVPASYTGDAPVPLLFNFHGYGSNATEQMWYGDFRSIADEEGFLIVHPEGTLDATETTHFNVGWGSSGVDDVGFASALIDAIAADYNIDLKRVYSTGMSNGGYISYHLACNLSDRIAAVASVTGSMSQFTFNNCDAQHPTPILQIHGTADGVVPYAGGLFAKPIEEVVQYWVAYNNCNGNPRITELPDLDPTDESTVERIVYEGGDNDVSVELLKIIGGGHTWAGAAFDFSVTNYDIIASEEVWSFLSRYDIDGLRTTTNIEEVEATQVKVYPNPSHSIVHVELTNRGETAYTLSDIGGQLLQLGTLTSNDFTLDISDLPKGMYFLEVGSRRYKVVKD